MLDFLLLCRTDVCRCAEVVLTVSVVFEEDNKRLNKKLDHHLQKQPKQSTPIQQLM
jgi:hypothetical protein